MFYNYLKIAWRNLLRDRQFSLLNLFGLAIGLTCALLIWLWSKDELQTDHYHRHDARLYQVLQNLRQENDVRTITGTQGLLAAALAAEMPEVEKAATVVVPSWFSTKAVISQGDTRMKADAQFVSQDYFQLFSCPVLQGDTSRLFHDKRAIAISDQLAAKLFPGQNAVGRTADFQLNEFGGQYVIAAVFEQPPATASQPFSVLLNFELFVEKRPGMTKWGNSDPHTYVLLHKDADVNAFNNRLAHFLKDKTSEDGASLFARPYADQYLYNQYSNGVQTGGRITYVKLFLLIAAFILLIACINFMNLSTARAARRMKETGIRKVAGATRGHLILQHLGESMIMSFCALALAVLLLLVLLPAFNQFTGKSLSLQPDRPLALSVLAITVLTGFLAGSYPALYISRFRPALALKGIFKTSGGEAWVRKGLMVFQFTLSVIAICAVLVIYRQMHFIQSKNLGYDRSQVIHFEIPLEMDSAKLAAAKSFLDEVRALPGVHTASSYGHNLLGQHGEIGGFQWPGKPDNKDINFANLEVGQGFLQTMDIQLKEGAYFSNNEQARNEIIFNETAIKEMGLKDPIGKTVRFWGQDKQVVGVAYDFNFESLYSQVGPCFFQTYTIMPNIIARLEPGRQTAAIEQIRKTYDSFFKGLVFDFRFMDDEYQALYASEQRVSVLSQYFTALAIIISCLGLFGLAAFTAQKRQKEIGIRKVLGATVSGVVMMLSKDFLKLLLLAAVIAFPLVWYGTRMWLNEFAYRIQPGADVFVIAGCVMVLITLGTISYQSVRAALANPARSLRD